MNKIMWRSRPGWTCVRSLGLALLATASTFGYGQELPDWVHPDAPIGSGPVAFVYVQQYLGSGDNVISAFASMHDGTLTPVPGSPFTASLGDMAVNGKYLLGSDSDGVHVRAWRIWPDGSLHYATSTDVNAFNADPCGSLEASPLVLDHTGSTLYTEAQHGDCSSISYQSFRVDKTTGGLVYLGDSGERNVWGTRLTFTGNNQYAYGSACNNGYFGGPLTDRFSVLRREPSGLLKFISASTPLPAPKDTSYHYCRARSAADPADNLISDVAEIKWWTTDLLHASSQLALYKIQPDGSITVNSTYWHMPWTTAVGQVNDVRTSPSGSYVAVSGSNGLKVFHANGSTHPTPYTGLLTSDFILRSYWDNDNHLYAKSMEGRLHVFTITSTGYWEDPGSPYTLPGSGGGFVTPFIVQPLTPRVPGD